MGIFDWFKRQSVGAADAQEMAPATEEGQGAVLGGLNFMTAIDAHMKWKNRLEGYIQGTSNEDLRVDAICRDDECKLGQWIYGTGGEQFASLEIFGEMKAQHANFHACAGRVLTVAQLGRKDDALRMLQQGDYVRASERVKMLLAKLYVQIVERQ
jgi:hypothetical protein